MIRIPKGKNKHRPNLAGVMLLTFNTFPQSTPLWTQVGELSRRSMTQWSPTSDLRRGSIVIYIEKTGDKPRYSPDTSNLGGTSRDGVSGVSDAVGSVIGGGDINNAASWEFLQGFRSFPLVRPVVAQHSNEVVLCRRPPYCHCVCRERADRQHTVSPRVTHVGPCRALTSRRCASVCQGECRSMSTYSHHLGSRRQRW